LFLLGITQNAVIIRAKTMGIKITQNPFLARESLNIKYIIKYAHMGERVRKIEAITLSI